MEVRYWSFFILGIGWLLLTVAGLIWPNMLSGKRIREETEAKGTAGRYRPHQLINKLACSVLFLICAFLPERVIYFVFIPVFLLIFASILICNKMNLERFWM